MADPSLPSNRLLHESSPYLLQHAHNPVDWYPWGEEALRTAAQRDLPILLSIGYSACHWCHVMERESFEDPEVARLMNESFINIKVDREERPDIDAIYMNYVQLTTGSGGWPLTVFLTPEQIPFFGGTYFPPREHYGRPSFRRVLESVSSAFQERREEIKVMGPEIVNRLRDASLFEIPDGDLTPEVLSEAVQRLSSQFDRRFGGFGGAPKFPSSMVLGFLLRHSRNSQSQPSTDMLTLSLDRMADGGIYDHLGGGFHRYSVDEQWLVPHFEKMLYDNALLARLYGESWQATGNLRYRQVAEETLDWVAREMLHPEGGFFSAQDADSEGEEGRYYVWSASQVDSELGETAEVFRDFFDVTPAGNFEGANILNRRYSLQSYASRLGLQAEQLAAVLDGGRRQLLEIRTNRIPPATDDKILTGWNGLMNSAFSRVGFALDRADFIEIAVANAEFLWKSLRIESGELRRSWKNGAARFNAYVEDYAAVVEAYLNLFETTGRQVWLDRSLELVEKQVELFWDESAGDFFFTPSNHEDLLIRQKDHTDNATPCGNSISCLNLLRLAEITGQQRYQQSAERLLRRVVSALGRQPLAFGYWLQGLDFRLRDTVQMVLTGESREELLAVLRRSFLPHSVLVQAGPANAHLPLLQGKSLEGPARVYVCRGFHCEQPLQKPAELLERLKNGSDSDSILLD